jgi:hypothetical protein
MPPRPTHAATPLSCHTPLSPPPLSCCFCSCHAPHLPTPHPPTAAPTHPPSQGTSTISEELLYEQVRRDSDIAVSRQEFRNALEQMKADDQIIVTGGGASRTVRLLRVEA